MVVRLRRAGLVAAGAAVAVVGYPLARGGPGNHRGGPDRRAHAVDNATDLGVDARRVVLVGHSVGAQLAAMCLVSQDPVPAAGAVLLSGLYELEPLRSTSVSNEVDLSETEVSRVRSGTAPAAPNRPWCWPGATTNRRVPTWGGLAAEACHRAGRAGDRAGRARAQPLRPAARLGDADDPVGSVVHALDLRDTREPADPGLRPRRLSAPIQRRAEPYTYRRQ